MQELLNHKCVTQFDNKVDFAISKVRGNRIIDRGFYQATESANHSILWHLINLVHLLLTGKFRRFVAIAILLGIESALINGPIKMMFRRTRPEHLDERPHPLRQPKTSSFPSGHATSAACAAVIFSTADPRRKNLYFSIASIVAFSRIYVRIHHASDVIAGWTCGMVFGRLCAKIIRKL